MNGRVSSRDPNRMGPDRSALGRSRGGRGRIQWRNARHSHARRRMAVVRQDRRGRPHPRLGAEGSRRVRSPTGSWVCLRPKAAVELPDGTGFALEALTPQDGWDWSNRWSAARLECVLAATDDLAAIDPGSFRPPLTEPTLTARADGWPRLDPRAPRTLALYPKLEALGARDLIAALEARAGRRSSFSPRFDTLIHLDVRADNCAWRADTRDVGLVDWTWLQVGDRRLDHAALLTSVRHSGFDVTRGPLDRLDVEALTWMAGYWFAASTKPVWPGGPSGLRRHQFSMAITALRLAEELR